MGDWCPDCMRFCASSTSSLIPPSRQVMRLTRERAVEALDGCAALGPFRRGAIKSFLFALSDDELLGMRIGGDADKDEIAGYLDGEEKRSGAMMVSIVRPLRGWIHPMRATNN